MNLKVKFSQDKIYKSKSLISDIIEVKENNRTLKCFICLYDVVKAGVKIRDFRFLKEPDQIIYDYACICNDCFLIFYRDQLTKSTSYFLGSVSLWKTRSSGYKTISVDIQDSEYVCSSCNRFLGDHSVSSFKMAMIGTVKVFVHERNINNDCYI